MMGLSTLETGLNRTFGSRRVGDAQLRGHGKLQQPDRDIEVEPVSMEVHGSPTVMSR